ncbi:MAG: hypothetical protein AAFQ58_19245 [Pseudomonadota bacterium]
MRFSSTRIAAPAGADPLRAVRAAQSAAQKVGQIADAQQGVEDAQFDQRDREARLFAQVERTRIDREIAADLDQAGQEMPESGAGFSDLALTKYDARVADARRRAGGDTLKLKRLNEMAQLDREGQRQSFEKFERDAGRQYSYQQHLLALDDYRQQVGRSVVVPRSGYRAGLKHTESGGRVGIVNDEGYMGLYQFGDERLADYKRATGQQFGNDEFLRNPALQERVMDWHEADIDQFIQAKGLDRYIGAEIGGVVMTRNAMQAMAHLGGKGGMENFLRSDGLRNPSDSNGTSLLDYARTHGGVDRNGLPIHTGPLPDLSSDPMFVAAREDVFGQIDAMEITKAEKSKLKRQAEAELTTAALKTMGEQNAPAVLALLQSGNLDKVLSYKQSETFEDHFTRSLERQVAAAGKAAERQATEQARQRADDFLAWHEDGRQGDAPQFTRDDMDRLSFEKRQAVLEAPGVSDAVDRAQTVPLGQADALLAELAPNGAGYSAEKAGYDKAVEIIDDRREAAAVTNHITAAQVSGTLPNMADSKVAAEMERRFDTVAGQSDNPFATAKQFIENHGVLTDGFNNMVASVMGGDDLDAKVQLSASIGQMFDRDPRLLSDEGNTAVDMALAVDQYTRSGVAREDAVKLAAEIAHPVNPTLAKARNDLFVADKRAMEEAAGKGFDKIVQDELGLEVPADARATYMQLIRDKFVQSGNVDVATKLAGRAFLQRYDVTRIGGKRVMRNPPESRYAVYNDRKKDSAWIEDQALERAREEFPNAKAVRLVAGPDQDRNAEPEYQVFAVLPDGTFGSTVEQVAAPFKPDRQAEMTAIEADQDEAEEAGRLHGQIRLLQSEQEEVFQRVIEADAAFNRGEATAQDVQEAADAYNAHRARIQELKGQQEKRKPKPEPFKPQGAQRMLQGK